MEPPKKSINFQRKPLTEAKRLSMSFEAEQECALICLLIYEGFNMQFSVPRKSSEICQFLDLVRIYGKNINIDMKEEIKRIVAKNLKGVNPESKHHVKYERRNTMAATINFLLELLQKMGCEYKEKGTKGSNITLKMKKIKHLKYRSVNWDSEKIATIGDIVNRRIKQFFRGKKRETLVDLPCSMIQVNDLVDGYYNERSAFKWVNPASRSIQQEPDGDDETLEDYHVPLAEEGVLPKIVTGEIVVQKYTENSKSSDSKQLKEDLETNTFKIKNEMDHFKNGLMKESQSKDLKSSEGDIISKRLHASCMLNSNEGFFIGDTFRY
ncbi:hypothetical protein EDI_252560 [Entamoeba dispar SAW760]|uniref:Uncharacterized protein n=1 Tax=Entamoeba dispar (strain ATCC PRA-260 / SAW760) TaxID=370354 RepID=B0EF61_ENTDS|nr:uncharacterized protein EDI_252560 [Entamoeba dispar SAW760]EDR26791.1 hypothetical protein EDI_252560 [Entamoeba dispar SAW760]|eukprot:EDR26791.1 hypothetical protein EDI_252560 [Entamoeba dispar SAW760]